MRIGHLVVLLGMVGCNGMEAAETGAPVEAPLESMALQVGNELEVCDGQCNPIPTDLFRSFVVTDVPVLDRFPLRRVLDQLVGASGAANTSNDLWAQWWSSQRVRTGADPGHHPFCDDNGATINGFPISCPRDESLLEREPIESHVPVGLFNRFDLAPMDGAHCGEYRIVYALGAREAFPVQQASPSPLVRSGRNFIIFEGVLPNPSPECGLAGCLPVAEFWQNLTDESDVNVRADLLEQFYFDGICDMKPVVLPEHYGLDCKDGGGYGGECGQIRTNQFIERPWNLREFTLERDCTLPGCELEVNQTTVAQNPHVDLWDSTDPLHPAFKSDMLAQMTKQMPAFDGVNFISAGTSSQFDAGESFSQPGSITVNDYDADPAFEIDIFNNLLGLPSTVTEFDIEERMTSQSCGGCHSLSDNDPLGHTQGFPDVVWPITAPGGFVHIDEFSNLSPGLLNHFLPHRQQVMFDFLATTCGNDCFPAAGLVLEKEVVASEVEGDDGDVKFELVPVDQAREQDPTETLSGSRVH